MPSRHTPETIVRKITIGTLAFFILWGAAIVLAQIKPFWVDEWRVIYNLKYKSAAMLFGPLDYMQQFPRIYLELINAFAYPFDYSYFTLRFPSWLVGTASVLLCYRLIKRLYAKDNLNRFLLVMILVSSYTFTEYFVQIKQYTMEILLSIVIIYQLLELLRLGHSGITNKRKYLLLCASFLLAPFFSYSYPIAVAPVFLVVFIQTISGIADSRRIYIRMLAHQWLPLFICVGSTAIFYFIDVAQVMTDDGMQQFWGHLLMKNGFAWKPFMVNSYQLFAQVGSGLLFSFIFGVLGIIAFLFGCYACAKSLRRNKATDQDHVGLYAVTLIIVTLALHAMGKLPVAEPRLNAFTVPAISILIIALLGQMQRITVTRKLSKVLAVVLYIGVIGNIYTTVFSSITGPAYFKKLDIYVATEDAIILAQAQKMPIFITPDIAFPYENTRNYPFNSTIPGDWVLKTFPAYKVRDNIPVYALGNLAQLKDIIRQLPPTITSVMAGDGRSFHIVNR